MYPEYRSKPYWIIAYAALVLAAWRGREQDFVDLLEDGLAEVVARGEESGVEIAQWARAVLANGLGRYDEALALLSETVDVGRRTLPEDHWFLGVFLMREGSCLLSMGRLAEAESAR